MRLDERRLSHLALPAALAIGAACWSGVPWGSFQFDDFLNVVRDPATIDPAALLERLSHGLRPLTRLSYFLDAQIFGMQAAGFLAVNLLLHLVTTALVFALARRRVAVPAAFIAALLFALQPANAEVVAYVSGRSTGLMAPLLLGGLLLHDHGHRAWAWLLFVCACLAKEVALVFPLLLLAWGWTGERPRAEVAREAAWSWVPALAFVALLSTLEGYRSMLSWSVEFRSVADNLLANGRAVPEMFSLWARPWALSADHVFEEGRIVASIVGLMLMALLLWASSALKRPKLLALALAWPLIAVMPTNSLIAKIDLVTEKPLYLAWVGPAIALGAAVSAAISAARTAAVRRIAMAMTLGVLGALAGAAAWRASLWRDPVALWTDAVTQAPEKSRAWNNLGMAYLVAHRDAEAIQAFEHALRIEPSNQFARTNLQTAQVLSLGQAVGRR